MSATIRIYESSPSELLAERLDREASLLSLSSVERADDYRRQARMLREMSFTQKTVAREMFRDNFITNA